MGCKAGPWAEAHALVDIMRLCLAPGRLGRQTQTSDGDEGARLLTPFHGGILDRHGFEIAAELDTEFVFRLAFARRPIDGLADGIVTLTRIDDRAFDLAQMVRDRRERELRHIVPEAIGGLAVIGLAKRMDVRRAAHRLQRRTFASGLFEQLLRTAEDGRYAALGPFGPIGRLGEELQIGEKGFSVGRGEDRPVDHDEILCGLTFRTREALARNADHLYGETARKRDGIVDEIAGIGRNAQGDRVVAGMGKEPLGIFGIEARDHVERALQDAMALGMNAAHRMAIVLKGRLHDVVERRFEALHGLGFGLVTGFDRGIVANGRGQGDHDGTLR